MQLNSSFSLESLAHQVGGHLDAAFSQVLVYGVGTIEKAGEGEICFIDNEKYLKYVSLSKASAILMPPHMAKSCSVPVIIVENPKWAFAQIVRLMHPETGLKPGIHSSVVVGKNTTIDKSASIGPHCVIGDNCVIGQNTLIYPNVTLYSNVAIGNNVVIHSGATIGSDGFGFAQNQERWLKIPHIGGVKIGNDVEIGANTTIDRGLIEDTLLEEGIIIDNLVHIAHNVHIGAYTAIAACVGIAGSAHIGRHCQIGGGSMINGHITIADYSYFIAGSQVGNSIKKSGIYSSGIPAKEYSSWVKNVARFHQLDALADRIKVLESELKKLNQLKIEDGSDHANR